MAFLNRIFNGYPYIATQEDLNELWAYVNEGIEPEHPTRLFYRRTEYIQGVGEDGGLEIVDGRNIVAKENVNEALESYYSDPDLSLGSVRLLYGHVSRLHVGISRQDVKAFLKRQEPYQMHLNLQKNRILTPIIVKAPDKRHQIDLIDMRKYSAHNDGQAWILNVIDIFSKHLWVYTLPNKRADSVAEALRNHYVVWGWPSVIQSDNGPEFAGGVKALIDTHCKFVHSQPYKPHSQGGVERSNGTIKRNLAKWMTLHNSSRWIDILPGIVRTYNRTKHASHRFTPEQAYNDETTQQQVYERLQAVNAKNFPTKPLNRLRVGDYVRVSWETIPQERKIARFRKGYMSKWSRDAYIVRTVSRAPQNPKYTLSELETGDPVPGYYFRHELLYIPHDTIIYNAPPEDDGDDDDEEGGDDLPPPGEAGDNDNNESSSSSEEEDPEPRARRAVPDPPGLRPRGGPLGLIGKRIKVYWSDKRRYYPGEVVSWSVGRLRYLVRYDAGTGLFREDEDHEVWEDLENERYAEL